MGYFTDDTPYKSTMEPIIIDNNNLPPLINKRKIETTELVYFALIFFVVLTIVYVIRRVFIKDKSIEKSETEITKFVSTVLNIFLGIAIFILFIFFRVLFTAMGIDSIPAILFSLSCMGLLLLAMSNLELIPGERKIYHFLKSFFQSKTIKIWIASSLSWLLCVACYVIIFEPFGYSMNSSEQNLLFKTLIIPPLAMLSILGIFKFVLKS